ncbi:glycoside hydrolase family 65 protein [Jeotgalibaca sp. A127]|uniref:glycoside hydrolase family 65 protein n=1 Tax=Jeotgalibaca sp. A127 TaxID=3457324 RepID=UPI003FD0FCD6
MTKKMQPVLAYNTGEKDDKSWIITETRFSNTSLGKTEAIFALGNGYMGLRSASEEKYPFEKRGFFVAGTFNKFPGPQEVSELPNAADFLNMEMYLNGQRFDLSMGKIYAYEKSLHLKKAELTRTILWETPQGELFSLEFRRFVSLADKHVVGQKVTIIPLSNAAKITVESGIDGQVTNSGTQHFKEGSKRLLKNRILKLEQETTASGIRFVHFSKHQFRKTTPILDPNHQVVMKRRAVHQHFKAITVEQNESLTIEKISAVYTSLDKDNATEWVEQAQTGFERIDTYDALFEEHAQQWQKIWQMYPIEIQGKDFDQLAVRFAIYHLVCMTPSHDRRMSIGAKGLTGERYKGHVFWDTEIFILPFYILTYPDMARQLLEYRWLSLDGARKKARDNNYEGAMFPWESAWVGEGEVTPLFGDADVVTGEATPVWSGFEEQHISADIAFAVWQYYEYTHDDAFMDAYGYELILATAIFWQSRLEWNDQKSRYEINRVIGPDEYKEHINNNAFTNYMAHWNMQKATEIYHHHLKPEVKLRLEENLQLSHYMAKIENKHHKLYLPQPNTVGIIPQDDTYLSKEIIDLGPYRKVIASLLNTYNMEQVNAMQISKQADVLMLLYLLGDQFSDEIKLANWTYYEPKTLHDSSLSKSAHSLFAATLCETEIAYAFFSDAARIDLGQDLASSDTGVHAASLGGILEAVLFGFGGIQIKQGELHIEPQLPAAWQKLSFRFYWRDCPLQLTIESNRTLVRNDSADIVQFKNGGRLIELAPEKTVFIH